MDNTRKTRTCLRCGYRWMQNSRTANKQPKTCSCCRSPYWNKERKKDKERKERNYKLITEN